MTSQAAGNSSVSDSSRPLRQDDLADIHDFAAKLTQEPLIHHLRTYVEIQSRRRTGATVPPDDESRAPLAPISVNLDLTTACNFACDHCVDMDILNQKTKFDHNQLLASLTDLAARGLRSVIVIGGGEPTISPHFEATIRHVKALGLALGLVTNGSRLDRVLEVAKEFEAGDWLRLSLDSGTDDTFQAMHKPRRPISLQQICAGVSPIKRANPKLSVGFSFIITWEACVANDTSIRQNIGEMVEAAQLAKASGFDYISYKPFLTRAESNNAEVVGLHNADGNMTSVVQQVRSNLDVAHALADETFRVVESTNLRVLERGSSGEYTRQPQTCHMAFFRQVLSPLGVYSCPVYRNVGSARIGNNDLYADAKSVQTSAHHTLRILDNFDASSECREVTCLYNHANWLIEDLVSNPERLETLQTTSDRHDYFL